MYIFSEIMYKLCINELYYIYTHLYSFLSDLNLDKYGKRDKCEDKCTFDMQSIHFEHTINSYFFQSKTKLDQANRALNAKKTLMNWWTEYRYYKLDFQICIEAAGMILNPGERTSGMTYTPINMITRLSIVNCDLILPNGM